MVQVIPKKQSVGNAFGQGLGQGIANVIPKEIERSRLASGLKTLSEKKGLTPFQRYAELSSLPGVTPQMIESGSRLLQQEQQGQALSRQNAPKPSPFPQNQQPQQQQKPGGSQTPSLTESDLLADVQAGYEPPSIQERDMIAGQAYNENPARFNNDPQQAIAWADENIKRDQDIYNAKVARYGNLDNLQRTVVSRLGEHAKKLEVQIPAEIYSRIEDEAIQATKPKKLGGGGLTEQQAMKDYTEKMNQASKDWGKIGTWGSWGVTDQSANETLRAMKSTQEKMEQLGATDLYANELMAKNKVSPKFAYAQAQPVHKIPMLNKFLKGLPEIEKSNVNPGAQRAFSKDAINTTNDIAPVLGELLKRNENASPLAIAYELEKKGYDPSTWLQWVTDNQSKLNLRQKQSEQLSIPQQPFSTMADYWLQSFSGIK